MRTPLIDWTVVLVQPCQRVSETLGLVLCLSGAAITLETYGKVRWERVIH